MINFIQMWMPEIAVAFFYIIFGIKIFLKIKGNV
jgi:hypothetical protein